MIETDNKAVAEKLMESFIRFRRLSWRQNPTVGLTPGEIIVLHHIKKALSTDAAGSKVTEISAHLNVASPTITQQINNLETRGYVQRNMDSEDRRVVRITITDKGETTLKVHSEAFMSTVNGLVEYLGEEDSNELADLLAKVFDYFQKLEVRN